jgi:RHS repeat-associated protein
LFLYNLRFPGQYYMAETGLNQNWNRDYDPLTGKYVESDPIGLDGGLNTYAYVDDSPISEVDPFGLEKLIQYIDDPSLSPSGIITYPALVLVYDTNTNQIAGPYRGSTAPDQSRSACNGGCVSAASGRYHYKRALFPFNPKASGLRYFALYLGNVPATGPNPNNNGAMSLTGMWIHKGGHRSTGSEGCLTIDPLDWPSFMANFGTGESGTLEIIR